MPTSEDGSLSAVAGIELADGTTIEPTQLASVLTEPVEDAVVFSDTPVSVSTSTAPQAKLSGTCPALSGGTYKVTLSYRWSHDAGADDFAASFEWDGSPLTSRSTGDTHLQEPKDAAGANVDGTGTDQAHAYTHVSVVAVAAGATPTVQLDYRTTNAGAESSIWDAFVIVERIGA